MQQILVLPFLDDTIIPHFFVFVVPSLSHLLIFVGFSLLRCPASASPDKAGSRLADRCHSLSSLHPPPAAVGSLPHLCPIPRFRRSTSHNVPFPASGKFHLCLGFSSPHKGRSPLRGPRLPCCGARQTFYLDSLCAAPSEMRQRKHLQSTGLGVPRGTASRAGARGDPLVAFFASFLGETRKEGPRQGIIHILLVCAAPVISAPLAPPADFFGYFLVRYKKVTLPSFPL